MTMTRQSRHRCFQPKPVEILAEQTIEGKRYGARLRHSSIHEVLALMHQPFEHVGCSQVERVAPPSLHPAHALASQTLNFPSPCEAQVRENPRLYGKEVEIKVEDTVLMVNWEEEREGWKSWNGESAG